MGFTAVTNNMDWSHINFLNQFVNAINERRAALGGEPLEPVEIGDDVQAVAFWVALQDAVEGLVDAFVNSHDYPDGFDGETAVVMYDTASWRVAAGMASGWRRARTMPANWTNYNDPAFSYGPMQVGDIIGPWLFVDLQAGLKALVWTGGTTTGGPHAWTANGENNAKASDFFQDADLETAKAWAEESYAAASAGPYDLAPNCIAYAEFGASLYGTELHRNWAYLKWVTAAEATAIHREIEFYAQGYKFAGPYTTGVFDGGGDFPTEYEEGALYRFATLSNQSGTAGMSKFAGSLNQPAWAIGMPPAVAFGYEAGPGSLVFKWNVEDGFEYV